MLEESAKAEVERIRDLVRSRVLEDGGPTPLARKLGVAPNNIRSFLEGRTPKGERWEAIKSWADRTRTTDSIRDLGGSTPFADSSWLLVTEAMLKQARTVALLAEQTRENQEPVIRFLEQLDRMYRQPAAALTPDELRAKMDETGRRQLEADAASAARRKRKATG